MFSNKFHYKRLNIDILFFFSFSFLRPKSLKVADFGCGDAKLAASIQNKEMHSFDLVALNNKVTVADIANVSFVTLVVMSSSIILPLS